MSLFKKAIKKDAKARVALCGPAGSGKTYTGLTLAKHLSEGGQIAVIDTEHGSASKYADLFEFDCLQPANYDPRELIQHIKAAVEDGYKVIFIDSLSHYWMGKGGELDIVDGIAKRSQSGNSFNAWRDVTPIHNQLVDTIIASPIHIIASMRTKTEWVIEKNEKGKNTPRKIGMAPVMREGIEYEFDLCGDLDQENTLTITKSRCPALSGEVINRPGKDMAQKLLNWLKGVKVTDEPKPMNGNGNGHVNGVDPIKAAFDGAETEDGIKLIWTGLPPELKKKHEADKNRAKDRIAKSRELFPPNIPMIPIDEDVPQEDIPL